MATKYIVNTKKMSFQFGNGKILEKKGVLAVSEEELESMNGDYFFANLKEKGVITITSVKPSEFTSAGEIIAADNAKIKDLEKQVAELKAQLAEAQATGKETATVIDSNEEPAVVEGSEEELAVVEGSDEEENKASKKGKK